jgi:hypothetical protein
MFHIKIVTVQITGYHIFKSKTKFLEPTLIMLVSTAQKYNSPANYKEVPLELLVAKFRENHPTVKKIIGGFLQDVISIFFLL